MTWSTDLAAYAQGRAKQIAANCELGHDPNGNAPAYGENLFMGSGDGFTPLSAAQTWYDERKAYHNEAVSQSNVQNVGHYTQMVWKASLHLGFGKAQCQDGTVVFVANYDPRGNIVGQKPF